MKASELIKELQKQIDEHGDLEVEHDNPIDGRICSVRACSTYSIEERGNVKIIALETP